MAKAELGGVEVKKKKISCDDSGSSADHGSSGSFGVCAPEKRETPEDRALRKSSEAASEETDSEASKQDRRK